MPDNISRHFYKVHFIEVLYSFELTSITAVLSFVVELRTHCTKCEIRYQFFRMGLWMDEFINEQGLKNCM